jgi:hypothetical protein
MILALIAAAMNPTAPGEVERLVARLGLQSDYRSVEAIGRYGCRAVPALVRQLEVVRVVRVLGYEEERHPREIRVAWTIAALPHYRHGFLGTPATLVRSRFAWRPVSDPRRSPDSTKFFGIWRRGGATILRRRPSNGRSSHNGADTMRPGPAAALDRIPTSDSGYTE